MSRLYPVTIITTRYGGAYECGEWAAFHLDPVDVPEDAMGGDPECAAWWARPTVPVGVGANPNEALAALERALVPPDNVEDANRWHPPTERPKRHVTVIVAWVCPRDITGKIEVSTGSWSTLGSWCIDSTDEMITDADVRGWRPIGPLP